MYNSWFLKLTRNYAIVRFNDVVVNRLSLTHACHCSTPYQPWASCFTHIASPVLSASRNWGSEGSFWTVRCNCIGWQVGCVKLIEMAVAIIGLSAL